MSKHEYTLTFRGDTIETFKSVYPEVHVVLTYRRFPKPGRTYPLDGAIASRPRVDSWYKTAKYAIKVIKDDPTHLDAFPGQSFVLALKPGTTEITDSEIVEA